MTVGPLKAHVKYITSKTVFLIGKLLACTGATMRFEWFGKAHSDHNPMLLDERKEAAAMRFADIIACSELAVKWLAWQWAIKRFHHNRKVNIISTQLCSPTGGDMRSAGCASSHKSQAHNPSMPYDQFAGHMLRENVTRVVWAGNLEEPECPRPEPFLNP